MATYTIKPDQLQAALAAEGSRHAKAVQNGLAAGARRFEALMVAKTKEAKKVDQGQFLAAWETRVRQGSAEVVNDAPHAGIIELGARPHPVSEEGRANIARWFMRKLGLNEAEAKAAASAVARKLRRYGQKGTFIVRDNMDQAGKLVGTEIARRLRTQ